MSESFPITEAQLTGNFAETLTYGIYLVTCTFTIRTLLFTSGPEERLRRPHEIRWMMLSVALVLFVVNTFDDVIGLVHNIQAFVKYNGPGGPGQELTNIHDWINIARSFAQIINMILGDFVLIYRCYIVYARRWPVVFPSLILYLAGIAMGVKLMHVEITTTNGAITLNSNVIKPWWSAFFCITAVQNVLTTTLLVWRIWRVEHQNDRFRGTRHRTATFNTASQPRLKKVIRVIAESGAAYTTLVFMTFVVSMANSNALYPLSDATIQATGITFNVIIVRSSPRRDEQFSVFDTNERAMAEQGHGTLGGGGGAPGHPHPRGGTRFSSLHFISNRSSTGNHTTTGLSGLTSTTQTQSDTVDIDLEDATTTTATTTSAKDKDKLGVDDGVEDDDDESHLGSEAYGMRDIKVNVTTVTTKD